MKVKKLNTVNVLESINVEIQCLRAFPDTIKGNLAAENMFMRCVQENQPEDRSNFLGIDYYLEEGSYNDGNGYYVYLIHSS